MFIVLTLFLLFIFLTLHFPKNETMKSILQIFLAATISLLSCNQKDVSITEPTNEELIEILPEGNEIASKLMKSLKAELKAAITEGGFENAIEVCNIKALPITESITDNNIKIKRITYKTRNPENTPNDVEILALDHFQSLLDRDEELPTHYVQKVTQNDVVHYYYYKPLMVGNVCLGCHGSPENMDTKLLSQISKLYPEDEALGYKEGDFRGLISVIIPE